MKDSYIKKVWKKPQDLGQINAAALQYKYKCIF